jgi:hypothetical protein
MALIPENVTANALLLEVKATDIDTGIAGHVHYTRIAGYRNSSLLLNSVTGAITIATDNHGFDREESSKALKFFPNTTPPLEFHNFLSPQAFLLILKLFPRAIFQNLNIFPSYKAVYFILKCFASTAGHISKFWNSLKVTQAYFFIYKCFYSILIHSQIIFKS